MAASVLDLTASSGEEEETVDELKMVVNLAPESKPSVRFGPTNPRGQFYQGRGRGSGLLGLFRPYQDHDVKAKKKQFVDLVREEAHRIGYRCLKRDVPVLAEAWFFLKRPNSDFVNKDRTRGLRDDASSAPISAVKPDTDNLAKFLLDALSGVVYKDNARVVDLRMYKLRDSVGLCESRTAFRVCSTDTLPEPDFCRVCTS